MTGIEEGASPLMYACQQSKEKECLDILAKKPSAARESDRTQKTPLHYCAESLNTACAEALLRVAPDIINARDEDGYSPLHLAVIAGNKPLIQKLLSKGADVNALDHEKHSVVHWATVCGEQEALDMVVRAGASISSPDMHGGYPLHYAAQMCGPGAELRGDPRAGLSVLRTLLACGANVDERDKDGRQPILWAASADAQSRDPGARFRSSGSAEAILALVKAGAKVEAADKDGLTALHCAASRGHTDCIETLVALCGCHVDTIDINGCTALFYAATLGHADATQLLLSLGAEPNRQDRKGRTPAHCGAAKGQLETLRLLLAGGANLWLRNVKGDLPLHEAVASGRIELVRWLLNQRMDVVNVANNDGKCAIHVAAINNNVEMMKVLLDGGSLINPVMRSNKGGMLTPLDAALLRGHRSCAKFLQLHGGVPRSKLTDSSAGLRGNVSSLGIDRGGDVNITHAAPTVLGISPSSNCFGPLTPKQYDADDIAIRHVERIEVPVCHHQGKLYDPVSSDEDKRLRRRRRRRKSERRRMESYDDEDSNSDEEESESDSRAHKKSGKAKHEKNRKTRKASKDKRTVRRKNSDNSDDDSKNNSPEQGNGGERSGEVENDAVEGEEEKLKTISIIESTALEEVNDKSDKEVNHLVRKNSKNGEEIVENIEKKDDVGEYPTEVPNLLLNTFDQNSSADEKEDIVNTKFEVEAQVHQERRKSFTVLESEHEEEEESREVTSTAQDVHAITTDDLLDVDTSVTLAPLDEPEPNTTRKISLDDSTEPPDPLIGIADDLSANGNKNDILENNSADPSLSEVPTLDEAEFEKNGTEANAQEDDFIENPAEIVKEHPDTEMTDSEQNNETIQTKRETTFLKDESSSDLYRKGAAIVDIDEIPLPIRSGRRQSFVFEESVALTVEPKKSRRRSDGTNVKSARRGRRRSLFDKTESQERLENADNIETAVNVHLLSETQFGAGSIGDESGSSTRQEDSSALRDSGIEPSPRHERSSPSLSPNSRIPRLCRKGRNNKPITPVSVTRAVQNTIRKYHLERKIFYQLLELKRLQIRAGRANEQVLVKRLVDEYQRAGHQAGLNQYTGTYSFRQFERFLYDQLHTLQSGTQLVIPQLKPSDDIETLSAILNRTRAELQDELPDNPTLCTHSTHRCPHAAHAYTGIPCAAYISKLNHHTMPKEKSSFLPHIDSAVKKGRVNSRLSKPVDSSDRPVTLELIHGRDKQVISLPTEKLDRSKRYYVTFTIKGGATPPPSESPGNISHHHHAKTV